MPLRLEVWRTGARSADFVLQGRASVHIRYRCFFPIQENSLQAGPCILDRGAMRSFAIISRIPWPTSFAGRIMVICFLTTHIPLLALIVWITTSTQGFNSTTLGFIAVVLAATVISCAATLALIWLALRPLNLVCNAFDQFVDQRTVPTLPTNFRCEIGRVMASTQCVLENMARALNVLETEANFDPLTGVGNRRWLFQEITRKRDLATPAQGMGIVLVDIDHFKEINDSFGHVCGDTVLRGIAETFEEIAGVNASIARVGGDEFCLVIEQSDFEQTIDTAQEICRVVASNSYASLPPGQVTASFGVTTLNPAEEMLTILERADEFLYRAKTEGRNCVVADSTSRGTEAGTLVQKL
jgi:diguanylate cyclase (GGDEF)-like protein